MAGERNLADWQPCALPGETVLEGYGVRLEPFDLTRHPAALFPVLGGQDNAALWDWILHGPFDTTHALGVFFAARVASGEWKPMVIYREGEDAPAGTWSYMRLRPDQGSAEIGFVLHGFSLQKSRAGTAAFYLGAKHLFEDLGYRRYEWKCNAQNEASRRAAERYGFTYEGRFRNDAVWRGRNRDTDWYSIIDSEWPLVKVALEAWLDPGNFDAAGNQRAGLATLRERLAKG